MDEEVHDLGATPKGWRRIVGVNGGRFSGPKLNGIVLPGGGDWLLRRPPGADTLKNTSQDLQQRLQYFSIFSLAIAFLPLG
jgi:hypothetical protein